MHEPIVLSCFRRACIAHTVAILLHGYWAIQDPPTTSLVYAIYHTRLVKTISCKGQVTHTHRQRTTPPTPTHTHDKNNTPNPQTNTPHKHLTTLEAILCFAGPVFGRPKMTPRASTSGSGLGLTRATNRLYSHYTSYNPFLLRVPCFAGPVFGRPRL